MRTAVAIIVSLLLGCAAQPERQMTPEAALCKHEADVAVVNIQSPSSNLVAWRTLFNGCMNLKTRGLK